MLTFEEWRHTYADVFETDDAARAAWTAASNKGYSAGVQDTRELLAAHSAGAQTHKIIDDGEVTGYVAPSVAAHPQPLSQTDAARDVMAERQRQIEVEGFSPTHDSKQTPGDLARAAACYAMHAAGVHTAETHPPSIWPRNWSVKWWKPDVSRRDLVKAAALILAEIERLDRAKGE